MKTNLFGTRSVALLIAFLTFSSAAPAQDDDSPDYFRRPLRVQTAAGKQATIADFARAFASADQEKDPLFSATLARIDGGQPKLPQGDRFTCLIDRPHGYFRACYTFGEGGIDPNQILEVCYWRTDTDHRLVAAAALAAGFQADRIVYAGAARKPERGGAVANLKQQRRV